METIEIWTFSEAARELCGDVVAYVESGDGVVFVLCDGVGGHGRAGRDAADVATEAILAACSRALPRTPDAFEALLREVDLVVASKADGGETTVVALAVSEGDGHIWGASCGDSMAWLVSEAGPYELTGLQHPRPRIGSRASCPIGFGPVVLDGGVLAMASDGLWRYMSGGQGPVGVEEVTHANLEAAGLALVDQVRLADGGLRDDVSVILIKEAPA